METELISKSEILKALDENFKNIRAMVENNYENGFLIVRGSGRIEVAFISEKVMNVISAKV